jgi:hypothetical protein
LPAQKDRLIKVSLLSNNFRFEKFHPYRLIKYFPQCG